MTGAAGGIGRACVRALLDAGYDILAVDTAFDEAIQAPDGQSVTHVVCDVGDPVAVSEMLDHARAVSVLVNNAGIARPGDFLDYSLEDWRRTLDVNLTGAFLLTQRVARDMIAAGINGAIVNMSSINARVAIPTIPAYCASKGGIEQLTRCAALALAPHGIRVNAVAPGSIDTPMVAGVNSDPEAMARLMTRTPLKRLGTADEIAEIVAFLASDKAAYITGETIVADGGRLALNYTC